MLGKALMEIDAFKKCLISLYNAAIRKDGGEIIFSFNPVALSLATLPWEVTHTEVQPLLLAKNVVLKCTRVIEFDHAQPPVRRIGEHIRILTIAPRVKMDDVGRTFEQLARSRMIEILAKSPVTIEPLPQATMGKLYERLDQGPRVDILDYYGHGTFTSQGGALLFEDAHGGRDDVSASRLATLPNLPPLIVLHACQSAQLSMDEPLAGIATALSEAGVRAVLAMQLTTRMAAATNGISPVLYREMAAGESVQQAVAIIRQAMYAAEPAGVSWYVPALYLRQKDYEPFFLMKKTTVYKSNPFVGMGAIHDPMLFFGREEQVQRLWQRLRAEGNLSIVGQSGSGKSAMLALLMAQANKHFSTTKPIVIWLPLERKMKLTKVQLELAHRLGGSKAKATDLSTLLKDKRLILLLDDLGQLDKGEGGLEVRLWLRQLSQDRLFATVQLVATSLRPLNDIFKSDESPDYSPLHNVMSDIIKLGPFTLDEARHFITKSLEDTPFSLEDFSDILKKSLIPRNLRNNCRERYDELTTDRGDEHSSPL
jgi:hypothetical protein